MRSRGVDYTCESDVIEKVHDNRKQEIRLQPVKVDGVSDTVLLVDSDAKSLKERGMYSVMLSRYEQGLERIRKGIEGKDAKQRDPLPSGVWEGCRRNTRGCQSIRCTVHL